MLLTVTRVRQHKLPNTKDVRDLVAIETLWDEMSSLHGLRVMPSCQVTVGRIAILCPVILHHIICERLLIELTLPLLGRGTHNPGHDGIGVSPFKKAHVRFLIFTPFPFVVFDLVLNVFLDYLSLTFQDSQVLVEIAKDSSYLSLEFLAGYPFAGMSDVESLLVLSGC